MIGLGRVNVREIFRPTPLLPSVSRAREADEMERSRTEISRTFTLPNPIKSGQSLASPPLATLRGLKSVVTITSPL